ncbi:RDD family protein [Flavobacterium sp.]|uniref:RDD family protein n=1 Tax=Flavobacterium sp. TaxID=239 RepID=UPI002B4B2EED|nr:RDD family protein [Flavobacterium sp.]HLF51039.1 RDD family protein [Flavobacterium sp.]
MENKDFTVTKELFATRGQRFLNCLIDLVILYIIWISIGFTLIVIADISNSYELSERIETMNGLEQFLSGTVIMILYYGFMEINFSRTIAKYFTKTFVVMRDGSKPDAKTIVKRTLCRFIPFEAITFLNIHSRGWHDAFSQTYVVKKHEFNEKKRLFVPSDQVGDNVI